jgi:hypothetical protein
MWQIMIEGESKMFKKMLSLVVIAVLFQLASTMSVSPNTLDENKDGRRAEKVKAGIAKLGVGEAARVKVKLQDGTTLNGYVSEVGNQNFIVVDTKTGAAVTVAYPQVKQVKGSNLSTGARIAIGVAIIAAIITIVVLAGKS